MYTLKGFLVFQSFADNNPGVISPIGELSTYSKTYTKEMGYYSTPEQPEVDLHSFLSVDGDVPTQVPAAVVSAVTRVGQWIFNASVDGRLTDDESSTVSQLLQENDDIVTNVTVGEMIETGVTGFAPEWIEFTVNALVDSRVKLWLSDDAFRSQYDEFDITVVSPIDNLDDFFKTPIEVKAILDSIDDSARMLRIQQAKNENPETLTVTTLFTWANPLQPDIELSVPWTVLIYGMAGNNLDAIRTALIDFILANSQYTEVEWEEIFPDIFKSTEHILTPLWDNYSIPNETLQKGLFSPTVDGNMILPIARQTAPTYPPEHVDQYASVSTSNFRSIAFVSVGGPDNRDEIYRFKDRFPDYIVIPTTSTEFGRMSLKTQDFVVLLSKMLRIADEMTEFSDIPLGMSRLFRDDIMYLVAPFDGVQYLVVSKWSYVEVFNQVAQGG